jgi:F0F1-type ATP synthase membrane subunit b/b'
MRAHARIQNSSAVASSASAAARTKELEDELKKAKGQVANMTASAAMASIKIGLLMKQRHAVAATHDEVVSQLQQQLQEQSAILKNATDELVSRSNPAIAEGSSERLLQNTEATELFEWSCRRWPKRIKATEAVR